jgi:ABC-type polar amino acid transport system ATPase subunit
MTDILTLDGVVKRFGNRTILDGISMTVAPREIVCFVGPSGTGKSTLLRCINGLEPIQGGRIAFEGAAVLANTGTIRGVRRRIGMIFQHFNLYPHMTALQNVMLAPMVVHGEPRAPVEARARALFEKVRLSHRIDAYPAQLSGGEQQRVAIARALANAPALLLADEPTGNLDHRTSDEVFALLTKLVKAVGLAAMVATHNMELASRMGRILTITDGELSEARA